MSKQNQMGSKAPWLKCRAFPLEVFPPFLQTYVSNLNEDFGSSIDHLAGGILFATSVAIGRSHLLELLPGSRFSGHLFLAIAGPPNTNKSAALNWPLETILDRDSQAFLDYERALNASPENYRKVGKRFHRPAFLIKTIEPDIAASVHQDNLRGLGLYQLNLAHWIWSMSRKKEKAFWSAVWSDSPIDRKLKGGRELYILHPHISVGGILRTEALAELKRAKYLNEALADRLLFVYPDQQEKPLWTLYSTPDQQHAQFRAGINTLMDLSFDEKTNQPQLIKLGKASRGMLRDFLNRERLSRNLQQANRPILCETYTMRFCLLLQLLWWVFEGIDKDTVKPKMVMRAIQLKEYFEDHSRKVFNHSTEDYRKRLPLNKRKVYEALPDEFTLANGIAVAARLGIKQRTFQRFLKDGVLFLRVDHGLYEKVR